MNTAVIVTVHNPKEELINYIEELLSACVSNILIVNDASDAAFMPVFETLSFYPGCTVLENTQPGVPDGAVQTAYTYYKQHLQPMGCRFAYVVNPDNSKDRAALMRILEENAQRAAGGPLGCGSAVAAFAGELADHITVLSDQVTEKADRALAAIAQTAQKGTDRLNNTAEALAHRVSAIFVPARMR